jgi:hypothetical protein
MTFWLNGLLQCVIAVFVKLSNNCMFKIFKENVFISDDSWGKLCAFQQG